MQRCAMHAHIYAHIHTSTSHAYIHECKSCMQTYIHMHVYNHFFNIQGAKERAQHQEKQMNGISKRAPRIIAAEWNLRERAMVNSRLCIQLKGNSTHGGHSDGHRTCPISSGWAGKDPSCSNRGANGAAAGDFHVFRFRFRFI